MMEEMARASKYEAHEKELPDDIYSYSDVAMNGIGKIWLCSMSQNTSNSITIEQCVHEIQNLKYYDDRTGNSLDSIKVKEARIEGIEEVRKQEVYTEVPLSQCIERTGKKPIGTR